MIHTVMNESIVSRGASRTPHINYVSIAMITVTVALLATVSWLWTSTSIVDLGVGTHLRKSGLAEQWARGDVVVMVRHAERCDRSVNTCLGSADGITVDGSRSALAVGAGLQRLGLEKTRMVASPMTRTRQTAEFILGQTVQTQHWVSDCDGGFGDALITHKKPAENLVLITHSGCIDQFERRMGVRGGDRSSAYAQAFFVKVDGRHPPKIIGSLDADQWATLNIERLN